MKNQVFKKVFFDPGYLSVDEIASLMDAYECLKLIRHRKKDLPVYQAKGLDIRLYPNHADEKLTRVLKNDVEKIWSAIINDHQTSVLFDRTTKSSSEVFKFNELLLMCCCYQNWLEQEAPDLILFTVTPHNIKTWVLSKVAEQIGIPVIYFQESFFPWRQFLMEGAHRSPRVIPPAIRDRSEKDRQIYDEYIGKKIGKLEDAMPIYELNRLKKNNWKLIGIKSEIRNFFRKPLSSIEKVKSYLAYENLSKEISGIKYVAFFLHYQPERSTVPEGYGFGIQLAAILALQQALPEDTCLVVREHPSTYTYNFSKNYRSKDFYELIASIDRVVISPISANPYEIIDNSIATASITGTVIGEALVRGKPCIAFGEGLLQAIDSPNFHRYESIDGLRNFLAHHTGNDIDNPGPDRYYDNVCNATFSGVKDSDAHWDENSRLSYLSVSVINGMHQLLSGKLDIQPT